MANELIVNVLPSETRIVLLKNGQIVDYQQESKDQAYNVGDIFIGTVKKIVPGLDAAFVDIKCGEEAFLARSDLGIHILSQQNFTTKTIKQRRAPRLEKDFTLSSSTKKDTKIGKILKEGEKILVRITKEPIASKRLRVSSMLSLAGRYLLLIPFGNEIRFSKKIVSLKEKKRLRSLIESIKPKNFTVVVRKEAENREVELLDRDLRHLISRWEEGIEKLSKRRNTEDSKIIGELKRVPYLLRDMLHKELDGIIVDNQELYEELKEFIQTINAQKEKIVSNYTGKTPIFEHFNIEKQLRRLLSKVVPLEGGGHVVIEPTEAAWVIDVNSGSHTSSGSDHEEISLQVNEAAMKEIARQMPVRNMAGTILVDCISMKKAELNKRLYQTMKALVKNSTTKVNVLPLTRLGIMQITREKVRVLLKDLKKIQVPCLTCGGTGQAANSDTVDESIAHQIKVLLQDKKEVKRLSIEVHPYLYAYFTKGGLFSIRWRWQFTYFKRIRMICNPSLPIAQFKVRYVGKGGKEQLIQPYDI